MAVAQDKRASELTAPVSIADTDVFAGYRPGTGGEPNLDIRATAGLIRAPIIAALAAGDVAVAAAGVGLPAGNSLLTGLQRMTPPHSAFDALPFNVYRTPSGYRSDYDYEAILDDITGTTYYVDPFNASGVASDSNSGLTVALPLISIKTAVLKPDRGKIYICGGSGYLSRTTSGQFDPADWGSAPIALIAWGGPVKMINGNQGSTLTWTSQGTGAYSATLSGVMGVLLTSATDPLVPSLPQQLTARANLAAVQAASEGWATSDTTVYVKIPAGTTPAITSVYVLRQAFTLVAYTGSTMYLRGIHLWGFGAGMRHKPTTYSPSSRFVCRDGGSAFADQASGYNAISIDNVGVSALKDSYAYYGGSDCINIHRTDQANATLAHAIVLEENCTAKYSAWQRAEVRGPYQASTSHDGVTKVILNPTYGPTLGGPVLQDQGPDANFICYTWCLGGTLNPTGSPATVGELSAVWGYGVLGGLYTATWMEDVTIVDGGAGPVWANSSGPVLLRGALTAWSVAPIGSVGPY